MTSTRSLYAKVFAAGVALAALGGVTAAQARGDVAWSVGIGVPGVTVGAANGYYAPPAPVYYAPPPPVVYAPPRPVYYAPRPVYYAPPPPVVYGPPAYGYYRPYRHYYRY